MKKIFFSFIILTTITFNLFAQYNQEELLKEMQKMQEEMIKRFEMRGYDLGDSQIFIDTFYRKEFDDLGQWMPFDPNADGFSGMMDLLNKQLQQMDGTDWAEIEKLFKSFGELSPRIPAPDKLDKDNEEGNSTDKPDKKRKVYAL